MWTPATRGKEGGAPGPAFRDGGFRLSLPLQTSYLQKSSEIHTLVLSLFTVAVAEANMCLWSTNPLADCLYSFQ